MVIYVLEYWQLQGSKCPSRPEGILQIFNELSFKLKIQNVWFFLGKTTNPHKKRMEYFRRVAGRNNLLGIQPPPESKPRRLYLLVIWGLILIKIGWIGDGRDLPYHPLLYSVQHGIITRKLSDVIIIRPKRHYYINKLLIFSYHLLLLCKKF